MDEEEGAICTVLDCVWQVEIQNCEGHKAPFDAKMGDKIKKEYESQTQYKVEDCEHTETNSVVVTIGCMETNKKFSIVSERKDGENKEIGNF